MTDEQEPSAAPTDSPAVTPGLGGPVTEVSPSQRKPFRTGFATLRDLITFTVGIGIIVHQVFVAKHIDPAAMTIGVALTGLPVALGADEKKAR